MTAIYTGVFDTAGKDLELDPEKETLSRDAVEEIIPGIWEELRRCCVIARHFKVAQKKFKAKEAKPKLTGLLARATQIEQDLHDLDPLSLSLIGGSSIDSIVHLCRQLELALRQLQDVPKGSKSLYYRVWLAAQIAELMVRNGMKPRLLRDKDDPGIWSGDTSYAELLRLALGLVEGSTPVDLINPMTEGLRLFEKSKKEQVQEKAIEV